MKMERLSYVPKAKLLNVVLLGLNLIVRKNLTIDSNLAFLTKNK